MEKVYEPEYVQAIDKAMEDSAFVDMLANAPDKQSLIKLFAQKDIVLDDDVAENVFSNVQTLKSSDELDLEMLEKVSGGSITIIGGIVAIAAGALVFHITWQIGKRIVKAICG